MRRGVRPVKLRYIMQAGTWPSGHPRLYLRRPGEKLYALPDAAPESPAFLAAYARAMDMEQLEVTPHGTGTIGAAVTAFLASDRYLAASFATRGRWRRALDSIRKKYGAGKLADLAERHIRADISKFTPHPAIDRLKAWRAACGWWLEVGLCQIDPTHGIKRPKFPKSDGHTPWARADIAAFREHWSIETPQRLAMELIYWTGARMSDAASMTEAMIGRDGWLQFKQSKTGGAVAIPIRAASQPWAEPDGLLIAAMEARTPRHIALMVTSTGKPRSVKAASAWFSSACRDAGIEGKSAHGLRKMRAIIMAENGATTHQIAAWTGHESLAEVAHYSAQADRRRIITGTNPDGELQTFDKIAN